MNNTSSRWKGLAWVAVACLLGAGVAYGISPLVRAVPWRWEAGLTQWISPLPRGCRHTKQAQMLLEQLVKRIYPLEPGDDAFSISVQVAHDPAVNAFAGLGGHITLDSGLLGQAESPEEIAGILAHEIEHVRRRHILEGALLRLVTAQGISMVFSGGVAGNPQWARYFLDMGFSRAQETEADEGALKRLQLAAVDNRGFRAFFERMEKSESAPAFLSDHPAGQARAQMVETFDNRNVTPIMSHEEWQVLKHYCAEK